MVVVAVLLKLTLIVWFDVTLLKVYEEIAPLLTPSTTNDEMAYPELGVAVNVCVPVDDITTDPDGLIVPPVPAEALM